MKKVINKKLIALMLSVLVFALSVVGCSGSDTEKKPMSETNPLYSFDEVRELNGLLEAPFLLGASEEELAAGGFEPIEGGIEHHFRRYRSRNARDVSYTLGTRELHYGEPSSETKLYVTEIHISPAGKSIQKNADGSTTPVYETTRSVLGIRLGDNIEDARKKLAELGYEPLLEEKFTGGLPKTLDNTYKKGCIYLTLGAESGQGDISQINILVPYASPQIDEFNQKCALPAELGNVYNLLSNPSFKYVQNSKTNVTRTYSAEDGSMAIIRGFPDHRDKAMNAEISFTSDKYHALGVKCGMSEAEARSILTAAGCTEKESGVFSFNELTLVRLKCENGTVTEITASLCESTNLTGIEIK